VTMWYIWKWRNIRCFNNHMSIPSDKLKFLMERFQEIKDALFMDNIRNGELTSGKHQVHIRCEQPPEGWVILNTDGASRGNLGEPEEEES